MIRLLLLGTLLTAGCAGGERSDPTAGGSSGATADNPGDVGDVGEGEGEMGSEASGDQGADGGGAGQGDGGGPGGVEGEGEGEGGEGEGEGDVAGAGSGNGDGAVGEGEGEGEGEGGAAVGEGEGEPAPRELVHATPPSVGLEPARFTAWANDGTRRGPPDLQGSPTVMWFFPFAGTPG